MKFMVIDIQVIEIIVVKDTKHQGICVLNIGYICRKNYVLDIVYWVGILGYLINFICHIRCRYTWPKQNLN